MLRTGVLPAFSLEPKVLQEGLQKVKSLPQNKQTNQKKHQPTKRNISPFHSSPTPSDISY